MFTLMKWQDWANLLLGLWLAASPWMLGFAEKLPATMNAAFLGFILAVFSLVQMDRSESAKGWINLVLGLWLVFAPFTLGFGALFEAAVSSMVIGVLVAAFGAWSASLDREVDRWWHDHMAGH
jgi:hypothetical protein